MTRNSPQCESYEFSQDPYSRLQIYPMTRIHPRKSYEFHNPPSLRGTKEPRDFSKTHAERSISLECDSDAERLTPFRDAATELSCNTVFATRTQNDFPLTHDLARRRQTKAT